jgi:Protein of unknown function (DUF2397)
MQGSWSFASNSAARRDTTSFPSSVTPRSGDQLPSEPSPAMASVRAVEPQATSFRPFAHLSAPNEALYRRFMLAFVAAKRRLVVHLRAEDMSARRWQPTKRLSEPGGADPHAGWCGRGQGEWTTDHRAAPTTLSA